MNRPVPSPNSPPRLGAGLTLRIGAAIALMALMGACQQSNKARAATLALLEPGLEYGALTVPQQDSDTPTTVHVLRFEPTRFTLAAVQAAETGAALADAHAFRIARGAIAAINGGYFDPQYKPLGLLVSGGKQLYRLRKVDHGIFQIADRKPALQHAQHFNKPKWLEFALECGPRLVVAGKPLSFKPGVNRRTVLAHDGAGRVLMLASAGVISLTDLTSWLVKPPSAGGLGVVAALNLDGGSSTMFELAHDKAQAAIHSPIRVPIGVALMRRPAAAQAASVAVPQDPTAQDRE